MVTLGLSVGRGEIERNPQTRVRQFSPVTKLNAEADVLVSTAGYNDINDKGEIISFLSGSKSEARFTFVTTEQGGK